MGTRERVNQRFPCQRRCVFLEAGARKRLQVAVHAIHKLMGQDRGSSTPLPGAAVGDCSDVTLGPGHRASAAQCVAALTPLLVACDSLQQCAATGKCIACVCSMRGQSGGQARRKEGGC